MRIAPDVGHRLRGKFAAPRLLNLGLEKVGDGGNRLILAHVIQGNDREEYVFALTQSLELYDFYKSQIVGNRSVVTACLIS